ncbi:MAG: DEAD/DEAH box helicase [Peptostreptococcus sp.]|uniref:DEAD/DEAH box helicase n=1 Tax=Peptostreptococcus sp. TaxID=1262 RepID=UPI002FCAF2F5
MKEVEFNKLKLKKEILKAIDLLGYKTLTKVQKETIPYILEEKDVVVKSETGSGKTLAFAIPICNDVVWDERSPQALVIVPTRELAIQVKKDFFEVGRLRRLKTVDIYGKSPYMKQETALKARAHVVVGTPGRIIDHIERGNLRTDKIKYLVLDESDEMLNMGFLDQVETIIENLPKNRTNLLFSATMPEDIEKLSSKYMNNPKYVEIESNENAFDRIEQIAYKVEASNKLDTLKNLTILENPDNCIVFCNTRDAVEEVYSYLDENDYKVDKIHGGMEQDDRTKVMQDFKMGKFRYLVATDVAARGIDVEDITHVINYDIPRDIEPYIHRIGRTGRKKKTGKAISFYRNNQGKYLSEVESYTGRKIIKKDISELTIEDENIKDFEEKMREKQVGARLKGKELNKGIIKLHINAGKKTKMRAGDIVGAISNIDGVSAEDIGVIDIIPVSSFVEILNGKGEYVLKELQKVKIKGRIRNVTKATRQ